MAYYYNPYQAVSMLGLHCLVGALSGHPCSFTRDDRDMRRATVDIDLGEWINHDSNWINGNGYIEHVVMCAIQELLSAVWITGEKNGARLLVLERDHKSMLGLTDSYLVVSPSSQVCLGMCVARDWMTNQIKLRYDLEFKIQERPGCVPFYYDPHQAISSQFLWPRSNARNNWNP